MGFRGLSERLGRPVKIAIDARRAQINKGMDRYVYELLRGLNAIDFETEYVVFSKIENVKKQLALNNNFSVEGMRGRFRLIGRHGLDFLGSLLFKDIDLCHFTTGDVWYSHFAKTLVTIHDIGDLVHPELFVGDSKDRKRRERLYRYLVKNTDYYICVSNFSKEEFCKHFSIDEKRVYVVHNGVGERFRPISDTVLISKTKRKYEISGDYILFVGALEAKKNVLKLIGSYELAEKNLKKPFKLVIVGKYDAEKPTQYPRVDPALSRIRCKENVVFTGFAEEKDLPVLYNGASVLVFPSIYEGFGLPALEAMACGTPVIVSNRSALPEIAGDAGIYVDPYDREDIAEKIVWVLDSPEVAGEYAARGIRRARLFSWRNTAVETLKIYQQVVQGYDAE